MGLDAQYRYVGFVASVMVYGLTLVIDILRVCGTPGVGIGISPFYLSLWKVGCRSYPPSHEIEEF